MIFQSVHQLFQLVFTVLETCFHFLDQLFLRCFAELAAGVNHLVDVLLLRHTTRLLTLQLADVEQSTTNINKIKMPRNEIIRIVQ